jgi:signal peptidase I
MIMMARASIAIVGVFAVAAVVRRARRRWLVVTVRGRSMMPTLQDGERVLARRVSEDAIRRGTVVVFRPHYLEPRGDSPMVPNWRVKRVAAIAGDPVPPWLIDSAAGSRGVLVPAGHVVVQGDNAPHSEDSRQLGFVPLSEIVGVVGVRSR